MNIDPVMTIKGQESIIEFLFFTFQVVKALIDNGCNVDIIDNEGLTAAELAEKCNHLSCAALIRGEVC